MNLLEDLATKREYGPISVVTNNLTGDVYGSAPGPDGYPVMTSFSAGCPLSTVLCTTATACERVWTEVKGFVPAGVRSRLDRVTEVEVALLEAAERAAAGVAEQGYTHVSTRERSSVG